MEQVASVRVCHGEDLVSQFIIGKCELGTEVLWNFPGAMRDMDYQGNRDAARRGQDFEVLAHGFRPCTTSDECASEEIIGEGQGDGDVATLDGATGMPGEQRACY